MEYTYKTKGTCAENIKIEINEDIITGVKFLGGGCDGNLKAISKMIEGWTVSQIEDKCSGITCGKRSTSCADQLARAVRAAKEINGDKN